MLCLSVYIYGALLAYGTVFANSVAAMFPLPTPHADASYVLYLGLFAILVIPLSCLELTEQIAVRSSRVWVDERGGERWEKGSG
jgi:amino acid permease